MQTSARTSQRNWGWAVAQSAARQRQSLKPKPRKNHKNPPGAVDENRRARVLQALSCASVHSGIAIRSFRRVFVRAVRTGFAAQPSASPQFLLIALSTQRSNCHPCSRVEFCSAHAFPRQLNRQYALKVVHSNDREAERQ